MISLVVLPFMYDIYTLNVYQLCGGVNVLRSEGNAHVEMDIDRLNSKVDR